MTDLSTLTDTELNARLGVLQGLPCVDDPPGSGRNCPRHKTDYVHSLDAIGGREVTDIDKVLADHRESTMPAWKGACAADGDDFPCLEYRMASELEAARKVVAALDGLLDDERCSFDHHGYCQTHFISAPCEMQTARDAKAEYLRVMEEQR